MMPYLFLLFIAMPIVEIAVLIQVGSAIGLLPTLLIVILTAVLGTSMLRSQGLATLRRAQARMQSGEMPATQLVEGMLLLVGGVLLLTPGFVTDAFGFACLIPPTRLWLAHQLSRRATVISAGGSPFSAGTGHPGPGTGPSHGGGPSDPPPGASPDSSRGPEPGSSSGTPRPRSGGTVLDGDYQRLD